MVMGLSAWDTVLLVGVALFYIAVLAFVAWLVFLATASRVDRRSQRRFQREIVGALRSERTEESALSPIERYYTNYARSVRGWNRRPTGVLHLLEEVMRDLDREGVAGFSKRYGARPPKRDALLDAVARVESEIAARGNAPQVTGTSAVPSTERGQERQPEASASSGGHESNVADLIEAALIPIRDKLEQQQRGLHVAWAGVIATLIGSVAAVVAAIAQLLEK